MIRTKYTYALLLLLFILILGLAYFIYYNHGETNDGDIMTYSIPTMEVTSFRRFDIDCNVFPKYKNEPDYLIDFSGKDIVFECADVGGRLSKENKAFYAILYKNRTLKVVQGDMCQSGTWSEETAAQLDERESHYDFSLPRLFAYSDYKIFKFKLSKKNYNALLDKLRLTEKYHPYADHFAIATGGRFDGIYFNGNCYGYIGPGYDSIAYDSYEDVFDSVIAIYAKRLKD